MVNIALGTAQVGLCPAGDADANGRITVDEILLALHYALSACPQTLVHGSNALHIASLDDARGPSGIHGCDAANLHAGHHPPGVGNGKEDPHAAT